MKSDDSATRKPASTRNNIVSMVGIIVFSTGNYIFGDPLMQRPIRVGGLVALILLVGTLALLLLNYLISRAVPKKTVIFESILGIAFFSCAGYVTMYFAQWAYTAYTSVSASMIEPNTGWMLLFGVTIILFAALCFLLRLYRRFCYGFSEALVGIVVACHRFHEDILLPAKTAELPPVALAILTGGIYLVVRGLDNMYQGTADDPVGKRFVRWLDSMR